MDRGLSHPHLYDLSDVARHVRLLTGCRQANASGRIGLPRASIRRRECPELAHMRQTTSASTGPVLGAYRTFGRPPATSQFDPERTRAFRSSVSLRVGVLAGKPGQQPVAFGDQFFVWHAAIRIARELRL